MLKQSFPLSGEREGGYWIGGNAYTAVAVAKKVGTGSWTVYNIFRDHLGTITHLKNGSTIDEYSFDAWGRRRDKDDWTYTLTSEPALFADRGFTGHEYLEDFKLYNMNGRMYDPVVGRFLSADPYIQDPGFTQSLNRYSYCLNNPLKYNDPTGEFSWLYFLGQLAGNYFSGVADNTINKKMPMNQAAKQFNFNMNYNPGSNRFFTPGVDAQMAARNWETGGGYTFTISGYWKETESFTSFDDSPLVFYRKGWSFFKATNLGGNSAQGQGGDYSMFFNGQTLSVMQGVKTVYSTVANSGKGEHMNNPNSQKVENLGPIPEGNYFFYNYNWQHQNKLRQAYNIIAGNGDWGDYNVPLNYISWKEPRPLRWEFYLHGGFWPGSAGCVDAGGGISNIYNYVKGQRVTYLRVQY